MSADTITTKRLVLRRFEPDDARAIHAIMSDKDAMQFWSTLPHPRLADTEQWVMRTIEAVSVGNSDDFIVLHEGRVIGKAGLWKGNDLGMIFDKGVWGTGLAAEAVHAVIERAKSKGLKKITADVDPRNTRSLKFLQRFGFKVTGRKKKTYKIGKEWADSVYLALKLG